MEWFAEFLRDQAQVEALFVGMSFHPSKALRKRFRVAVLASGADLGAPTDRIPGGIGPLDV